MKVKIAFASSMLDLQLLLARWFMPIQSLHKPCKPRQPRVLQPQQQLYIQRYPERECHTHGLALDRRLAFYQLHKHCYTITQWQRHADALCTRRPSAVIHHLAFR